MEHPYLLDIRDTKQVESFGKKGAGLNWLSRHQMLIPATFALTYSASHLLEQNPKQGLVEIRKTLEERINPRTLYAVRSSANLEDDKELSFAGQFLSKTNVQGVENILEAITTVIASSHADSLQPYLKKLGESGKQLKMAVLIQEMVKPVLSGVSFSKNPTTGLDEVVIEAVHGLGEALMQGGITPKRWIHRWGQFTSKPEDEAEFESVIAEIVKATRRIAKIYASPVDLEWVYDGSKVYWLQIRPITTLTNIPIFSNRISREFLPGIIKPLISSVNIPLVNTAWIRLFDSLMGKTYLKPEELTKLFHYRAYFNMGSIGTIFEILGFPREGLEILLGFKSASKRPPFNPSLKTFRHIPRILRFTMNAWNYDKYVIAELQYFQNRVHTIQSEDISSLTAKDLMDRIDTLYKFNIQMAYQNIVIPILMNVYNAIFKAQLKRIDVDILNFNLTDNMHEILEYDPNHHLDKIKNDIDKLPKELQEKISSQQYTQLKQDITLKSFHNQMDDFIQRFGHFSESGNDFSKAPWREEPDKVLQMLRSHAGSAKDNQKIVWNTLKVSVFAKLRMRPFYGRARKFRFLREQISSMYTSSYGWFRVYFNALARHFVAQNCLKDVDDIYYLSIQEVRVLVEDASKANELQARIQSRRDEIEQCRDISMPEIIYGNSAPPLGLMRGDTKIMQGIPTSSGYYQGKLKVILSTNDFPRVERGDVIAIPYSDVAWSPLFAKAGAVVAESGGMLSHSSIVAREYGIPCVVSVNNACRLPDGSEVIVDGYQGTIHVVDA